MEPILLWNRLLIAPHRGIKRKINELARNTQQQSLNGLTVTSGLERILRPRDGLPDPWTKTGPDGSEQMNGPPGQVTHEAGSSLWTQRTLKSRIPCVGIGVHSGRRISLTLLPAPAGHGIVFRRTDLGRDIPATYNRVVDTQRCTTIGESSARMGTIEHLMAALAGAGVDNVLIEVDGPEVPIMDGSAAPFSFLLECAGVVSLDTPRKVIEILRPVRVNDGQAFAELRPFEDGTRNGDPDPRSGSVDRLRRGCDRVANANPASDTAKLPRGRGVRPNLRSGRRHRSVAGTRA